MQILAITFLVLMIGFGSVMAEPCDTPWILCDQTGSRIAGHPKAIIQPSKWFMREPFESKTKCDIEKTRIVNAPSMFVDFLKRDGETITVTEVNAGLARKLIDKDGEIGAFDVYQCFPSPFNPN